MRLTLEGIISPNISELAKVTALKTKSILLTHLSYDNMIRDETTYIVALVQMRH